MAILKTVELIRSDVAVNRANYRCLGMIALYRIAHYFSCLRRKSLLGAVIASPFLVAYRFVTEWVFQYEIPAATVIGKGFMIDHGYGIVINKHSILGDFVRIKHSVTIGCKTNNDGTQGASPRIGSNVDIGAGAFVIGGISVGDQVKIGAGAVVVKDVPEGSIVVGNPARVAVQSLSGAAEIARD